MIIRGTKAQRDRIMALVILMWSIMGIRLAFSKARRGASLDWIGCTIAVDVANATVVATIMEASIAELLSLTLGYLNTNVVGIKNLRSYIGKAQSIASLLFIWRPFVGMLWAALFSDSLAPGGCIWLKQIHEPLSWLSLFMTSHSGALTRTFELDAYLNRGMSVVICVDASPFGLGAWLQIDGLATK